jgi:3-dehydroquinate synthase
MLAEAGISHKMGTFEETELEELENLILHCGLPVKMPEFDKNSVMKAMSHDKKTKDGKIRFALPRNIGDVYLTDEVDIDCIREALES